MLDCVWPLACVDALKSRRLLLSLKLSPTVAFCGSISLTRLACFILIGLLSSIVGATAMVF